MGNTKFQNYDMASMLGGGYIQQVDEQNRRAIMQEQHQDLIEQQKLREVQYRFMKDQYAYMKEQQRLAEEQRTFMSEQRKLAKEQREEIMTVRKSRTSEMAISYISLFCVVAALIVSIIGLF